MADERDSLIERVKTAEAKLTDLQSKNNVRNKHFVCVCVSVYSTRQKKVSKMVPFRFV